MGQVPSFPNRGAGLAPRLTGGGGNGVQVTGELGILQSAFRAEADSAI